MRDHRESAAAALIVPLLIGILTYNLIYWLVQGSPGFCPIEPIARFAC